MDAPWALPAQDILQHFGSDEKRGLIETKVQKHRELYGRNGKLGSFATSEFSRCLQGLK